MEKKEDVQVFRCMLYKQQPLFEILQSKRRKMFAIENIFKLDVKLGGDTPSCDLRLCGGRMKQTVLKRERFVWMS